MKISQEGNYDIIRLKNTSILIGEEYAGKPQLPVAHVNILLPKGATAINISITGQRTQIPGSFNIYPAQPPHYPNFEAPPDFVVQNAITYATNTKYPQDPLLEYSIHVFREYSFVSISFIPFSYRPQSGQLELLTQTNIVVNYTMASGNNPESSLPTTADKMARRSLENLVTNPEQIDVFYPVSTTSNLQNSISFEGIFDASDLPSSAGSKVPYVIITNNTDLSGTTVGNLAQKFQEYADWKTQKGLPAKVVTVDAIRANYPGSDVGEKIRRFIQEAHQKWETEYVLLGGGASIIPARLIDKAYRQHSDLYYSAIMPYNNWNPDGDGEYGENTSVDIYPDIAVGRAPINTEAEVDNFLKKNFAYARCSLATNVPDGSYLETMLAAYGDAFEAPWINSNNALRVGYEIIQTHHDDTYIYGMFAYNQNHEEDWCLAYYDDQGNGCTTTPGVYINDENLSHDGILAQMQAGYGIVNLVEHMTPYRMALGSISGIPPLIAQDFQGLADTGKYGVFVAGGCQSARIEMDEYMGEQWVNAQSGGMAFYGTNMDIGTGTSEYFNDNFFNLIYDEYPANYKLGWLHTWAANGSPTLLWMIQLLGDPEQSLYTKAPIGPLAIVHTSSITTGNQSFLVDMAFSPDDIDNVTVGLYKEGEVAAYVTASPDDFPLYLYITPDTPGELKITVTGHNLEPYEGTAQVTANPEVHLYKTDNISINDENNNGIVEPGETVNLSFGLRNTGSDVATNVSAVLSAGNSTVQISQNTSNFQNIAPGQTKTSLVDYTFTVPTENDLRALAFQLDISSSEGNFTEAFLLNLKSSNLEMENRSILVDNEETYTFQANDQAEIFFDIHNAGNIRSKGVEAVLTTELPSNVVSITNGTYTYGDIDVDETIGNTQEFSISIGPNYSGQALLFQLTLIDDYGKTDIFQVELTEIPPPQISNFKFEPIDTEITLTWNAVSEIRGYNIYRSDTQNGPYVKQNQELRSAAIYKDQGLQPMTEYWYKISVVSLSGNELPLPMVNAHKANTQLQRHATFPITATPGYNGLRSSPIAYDLDGNGTKEIFIDHYLGENIFNEGGRIMGFYETGEELFDIDDDLSTVWGFARTFSSISANPAIGDIDDDGLAEVIAIGRGIFTNFPTLYGFRTTDENGDNKPD